VTVNCQAGSKDLLQRYQLTKNRVETERHRKKDDEEAITDGEETGGAEREQNIDEAAINATHADEGGII
jgi:hypothetical protein